MQRRGVFCFVRQDSAFIGAPYTMMFGGQRLCLGSGARSQLLSAGVRGAMSATKVPETFFCNAAGLAAP